MSDPHPSELGTTARVLGIAGTVIGGIGVLTPLVLDLLTACRTSFCGGPRSLFVIYLLIQPGLGLTLSLASLAVRGRPRVALSLALVGLVFASQSVPSVVFTLFALTPWF